MSLPQSPLPWLLGAALSLLSVLCGACPAAGPRPAPTPATDVAVPAPVEEAPGSYRLESDRLSVEILLRAAGAACTRWGQVVDVIEAEPAREGRAAFVHYRCGPPTDNPQEQLE